MTIRETEAEDYLARGIGALARASGEHWVAGHFGATLLCGAWLLGNGGLPPASARRLDERLRRVIEKDPKRYALPPSGSSGSLDPIITAAGQEIARLRNGAHGTIYLGLGLRALHERPELATEATVEAICQVHRNAQLPDPGRYYGVEDHFRVVVEDGDGVPQYADARSLAHASLLELGDVRPDQTIAGKRYFFVSEKLHLVTHAHALIGLERFGHPELMKRGIGAHRLQMKLSRHRAPEAGKPSPARAEWWDSGPDPWHDVKFALAAHELLPILTPEQREQVESPLTNAWGALS